MQLYPSRNSTHDLLIANPTPYHYASAAPSQPVADPSFVSADDDDDGAVQWCGGE